MFIPMDVREVSRRVHDEGGVTHPPLGHSALRQWMECLKQALHSHSHQLYESGLRAAVAHKAQPQAGRRGSQPEVYNPSAADSRTRGKAVPGGVGRLVVVDTLEGKLLAVAKTLDLAEAQTDSCWDNKSLVRTQFQQQTADLVVD